MHSIISPLFATILAFTLASTPPGSSGVSLEQELTLTKNEALALEKFSKEMTDLLPHDWMKEDIYLVKFLRAKNFDVPAAKEMLSRAVKWRKDNNIDGILDEDWSYWDGKYPFYYDARDKDGRMVCSGHIAEWDPRPALVAGRTDELFRYALVGLETGVVVNREDRQNGLNVTQFTLVANMGGFSIPQHAVLAAIPFYLRFVYIYENYYPGMLHKLYLLNTPAIFDPLLRLGVRFISKETREALQLHGTNKNVWKEALAEEIDLTQLRKVFGGTKDEAPDWVDDGSGCREWKSIRNRCENYIEALKRLT